MSHSESAKRPQTGDPVIITERLILRKFCEDDLEALFLIYSDKEVNTFLPWYPVETIDAARTFFQERYVKNYMQPYSYDYAICLKKDNIPIGYVKISMDDSYDLGYGLRKEFWHKGIVTEAAAALIDQAKKDGLPYITATHDVRNSRSGGVMRQIGMQYQYSYEELWQPKNYKVIFRMYQMNLDDKKERVYKKYWDMYPVHFVEEKANIDSY
jgi:ribosomal-protein-alanine N-acetyltransferase